MALWNSKTTSYLVLYIVFWLLWSICFRRALLFGCFGEAGMAKIPNQSYNGLGEFHFKKMVPCMALLGFLPIFWQICASSRGQQVCKLLVVCLMHTQNIFFLYTCVHTGQNLVFFCEVATKNNMLVSTSIFTGRIGWAVYWPKTNLSVDLELAKYIHPPSINRCQNFV